MVPLNKFIKALKATKLSNSEIAKISKLSRQQVGLVMNGHTKDPRYITMRKLARVFTSNKVVAGIGDAEQLHKCPCCGGTKS